MVEGGISTKSSPLREFGTYSISMWNLRVPWRGDLAFSGSPVAVLCDLTDSSIKLVQSYTPFKLPGKISFRMVQTPSPGVVLFLL